MLEASDETLESNSRKIKHLCAAELRYMATSGKIKLDATPQGSMVLGLLKSASTVWSADTQLVESINSMIRMINDRCPRIDLLGISSRILIKKSLSEAAGQTTAGKQIKKWSQVREGAGPLLQELNQSGKGFQLVLNDKARFDPQEARPVTCGDLHATLSNEDLAKAIPDVAVTDQSKFAAAQVVKWKRVMDGFRKKLCAATRHSSLSVMAMLAPGTGSLLGESAESFASQTLLLHVATLRTKSLMVNLGVTPAPASFLRSAFWLCALEILKCS